MSPKTLARESLRRTISLVECYHAEGASHHELDRHLNEDSGHLAALRHLAAAERLLDDDLWDGHLPGREPDEVPVSRLDREAARKRCEAATAGPWTHDVDCIIGEGDGVYEDTIFTGAHGPEAAFVVGAREDLPAALDLLDRCAPLLREYFEAVEALLFSGGLPRPRSPESDAVRKLVAPVLALLADLETP